MSLTAALHVVVDVAVHVSAVVSAALGVSV